MDGLDYLKASLLDLDFELQGQQIPLILGGGYGLFLKQEYLRSQNVQTLVDAQMWPEARSTSDLDVFLRAEVVTNPEQMRSLRAALNRLQYQVVESAKFYQFFKPAPIGGAVKIDLLVGPLGAHAPLAKRDERRVRPRVGGDLHAHPVDEALGVEDSCMSISLRGNRSTGEAHEAIIYVPQGFSYLMMKLFAFRDRKNDPDKEMGRHHALDLFRIVAMLTREEYDSARAMRERYADDPMVMQAQQVVREAFGTEEGVGVLRIREHPLFRRGMDVVGFASELRGLFCVEVL